MPDFRPSVTSPEHVLKVTEEENGQLKELITVLKEEIERLKSKKKEVEDNAPTGGK